MGESEVPLAGFYDYRLVVLSVLVAISASYAALDLGARVTAAHGRLRWAWLAGGAIALGLGIWCMHFVGMLAFRLPIAVAYHLPTVVLSLLVAILASAMALGIASREKMGRIEALTGSVLMGAGIAGMHYIGMAAMRFPAMYRYRPPIVAASVLVAIVASLVAIVFCFDYREDFRGTTAAKILSAGAMGAAISLMHYTGMAAAYFSPSGAPVNLAHTVSVSSLGAAGAGMATLLVQAIAILTSSMDRQLAVQARELENSERFRQIADILRDVVSLSDADFSQVLFVNRAYETIWGRTVESLYADPKSWLEGVHPDDRQQVQEAVQRLRDGQPVDYLDCRVVRADGSISWVRLRAYPVGDGRSHPYRIVGTAYEFTMRKLAEDARQQLEEQYRTVVETAADAVISIDENSQILFANPATTKIFGYELRELIGKQFTMLMPEPFRERHEASLRRYLATGERHLNWQGVEFVGLHKSGAEFPVEVSFGEVVRQGQRIFTGFIRDITERKEAESRLRLVLDTTPAMIHSARPDGYLDYFNQRWLEYVGLPLEDLEGWGWTAVIHPEDVDGLVDKWHACIASGELFLYEARVGRADGEYRWLLHHRVALRGEQGQIVKWYGSSIDIEDRKRAEEALRSSEREQRQIAAQLERDRARLVEAQEVAKMGSWEAELPSLNVIWSEQTHRIFETDPSRFQPTRPTFREFIHPEDRAKVDAAFAGSFDKRTPSTVEYRIVMPDGRVKILEERWQAFYDEEGKPVRVAGTCRDITERVRTGEELQRLSGQLLKLQDEERRKIASDLHDMTGQNLVALATMLGRLEQSLPSKEKQGNILLSGCRSLVDLCIREVRTLSYALYPAALDKAGLAEAVWDYIEGFSKRSGIPVALEVSESVGRAERDVELALFRVIQESLANVHSHSRSQNAVIRINHTSTNLVVEIIDRGPDAPGVQKRTAESEFSFGVGIRSMQERVRLIGGHLEIISGSGGTIVRATVPLEARRSTSSGM